MKRIKIIFIALAAALAAIILLKNFSGTASIIWMLSDKGAWLLPLVLVAAILDSVHPCSFSILLITIAFLFGMQMKRERILLVGGVYIAGIFASYLLIGLGILQVLHLFNTPHFMGKLGATIMIIFGALSLLNGLFPKFPIKLKIPTVSHTAMSRLMEQASIPAAFGLGILVGICQFPCMGGPYTMIIGLLRDQAAYFTGFWYLVMYNAILVLPLAAVLIFASDKLVVDKMQEWKRTNLQTFRFWAGVIMILVGIMIFFI